MRIFEFGKRRRLLAWQKAILANSPDRLLYSEEQLARMTEGLIAMDVRIITESFEIIHSTTNPRTRKLRQALLAERIAHLRQLSRFCGRKYDSLIASAKKLL